MGGGAMWAAAVAVPSTPTTPSSSSSSSSSPNPFPNPNPNPHPFPNPNPNPHPNRSASRRPTHHSISRRDEKESTGGVGGEGLRKSSGSSSVFGPVPPQPEIERAITALQDFLPRVSSCGSLLLFGRYDPGMLLSAGLGRVTHAFHLLHADPTIKRLVLSLSSDRAIWAAIMNNESVRKLLASLSAENGKLRISKEIPEEPDSGSDILSWFLELVKDKITDLLEKFKSLVEEIFQQHSSRVQQRTAENTAEFEEKIGSSLLLSVIILLIVVLARVRGA